MHQCKPLDRHRVILNLTDSHTDTDSLTLTLALDHQRLGQRHPMSLLCSFPAFVLSTYGISCGVENQTFDHLMQLNQPSAIKWELRAPRLIVDVTE